MILLASILIGLFATLSTINRSLSDGCTPHSLQCPRFSLKMFGEIMAEFFFLSLKKKNLKDRGLWQGLCEFCNDLLSWKKKVEVFFKDFGSFGISRPEGLGVGIIGAGLKDPLNPLVQYCREVHWENYISISFQIEWDLIVLTVFYSNLNQMEIHFLGSKSKRKLSPRSYPIQFQRK